MTQGAGQIAFLVKHCQKSTLPSQLIHSNQSILQLESGWGGRILETNFPKTQRWFQTEFWKSEVCKFMSSNHIHIYHLVTYLLTQLHFDDFLMIHLTLNSYFDTSELHVINWYHMSKEIFFIRDICNNQGTNLHKSEADTDITLNMIHDLNWPRRHETKIAPCRTCRKSLRTLCE